MLSVLVVTIGASVMNTCRILLVDDHVAIRAAVRSLLAHYHGIRIVGQASDGQQALDLMAFCRPHVILMDINMPRMNGIEATSAIKSSWKDTVVIGLSAVEDPQHTNAIIKAGAVAVVSKHDINDLYCTIQQVCINNPSMLSAAASKLTPPLS
jgi:DNA-binding NarL/FixJ family response regulator